jgi:ABC-type uncharacterized transport system permease subunit
MGNNQHVRTGYSDPILVPKMVVDGESRLRRLDRIVHRTLTWAGWASFIVAMTVAVILGRLWNGHSIRVAMDLPIVGGILVVVGAVLYVLVTATRRLRGHGRDTTEEDK